MSGWYQTFPYTGCKIPVIRVSVNNNASNSVIGKIAKLKYGRNDDNLI